MAWLDPTTFGGAVSATITALLLWEALGVGTRRLRAWWERIHRFELQIIEPLTFEQFGETSAPRVNAATVTSRSGRIELWLRARDPWIGEEVQVRFIRLHLDALPVWFPLNRRRPRGPEVVCDAITTSPMGPEGFVGTSGGTLNLNQSTGARRAWLVWGPDARREIRVGVDYSSAHDWSGVLEIRVRIDERWFAPYVPTRIRLKATDALVTSV